MCCSVSVGSCWKEFVWEIKFLLLSWQNSDHKFCQGLRLPQEPSEGTASLKLSINWNVLVATRPNTQQCNPNTTSSAVYWVNHDTIHFLPGVLLWERLEVLFPCLTMIPQCDSKQAKTRWSGRKHSRWLHAGLSEHLKERTQHNCAQTAVSSLWHVWTDFHPSSKRLFQF